MVESNSREVFCPSCGNALKSSSHCNKSGLVVCTCKNCGHVSKWDFNANCCVPLKKIKESENKDVNNKDLLNREPTEAEIIYACIYYNHEFSMLSDEIKNKLRREAKEWFNAWKKTKENF